MNMRRRFFLIGKIATSLALGAFVGCQSYTSPFVHKSEEELEAMEVTSEQAHLAFVNGNYEAADATLQPLASEPTVSQPLYELERVSVLLMQGKRDEAHALMQKVRNDFEMLFDPQSEEKAASIWHGENNKVFKGDVHERATLYAFLAMSFMELGEWEDAERCVKNGLLTDSANVQNEQYNSDYALLHYLGAVACRKAGRTADADAYVAQMTAVMSGRGVRTDAGSSIAGVLDGALDPDALVIAWIGDPPQYVRGGAYEEVRHPVRGSVPFTFLTFEVDGAGQSVAPQRLGDVNWQALTRGGREMDGVLEQKAAVKSGFHASGNIFLVIGFNCITSFSNNLAVETIFLGAGGTCLALGGVCHLVGHAVNSRADIRCWRNLPGELVVMPLVMKGEKAEVTLRGYNAAWDNMALETVSVSRRRGAVAVRHALLLPSGAARETLLAQMQAIMAFKKKAETSEGMPYEIKEEEKEGTPK